MLVEPGPFRTDFFNEQTSAKFTDKTAGLLFKRAYSFESKES